MSTFEKHEIPKISTEKLLAGLNKKIFKENADLLMLPYKNQKEFKFLLENYNNTITKKFEQSLSILPNNENLA